MEEQIYEENNMDHNTGGLKWILQKEEKKKGKKEKD